MPVTTSAKKALRVSMRRYEINQRVRSQMKTAMKRFMENPSMENLSAAFSRIDRAVKNNLIHKNNAARKKARLSRELASKQK